MILLFAFLSIHQVITKLRRLYRYVLQTLSMMRQPPTLKVLMMYVMAAVTVISSKVKGVSARETPKTQPRHEDPPSNRNAMPSPRDAAGTGTKTGDTTVAARPEPPPGRDTRAVPEKGPPERQAANGDANEAPLEKPRTFPRFNNLPPELRAMIWHMAAENHAQHVALGQRCRCTCKPGALHFYVKQDLLRARLALLHVCRESRAELGPRYDAFEYNRAGMVEVPGDLWLRPGPTRSDKPGLTWRMDHRYMPFPPMPWQYEHPHMLVDCRLDTFSGMLTWPVGGYWAAKCYVEGCAFERPGSPLPMDRHVQIVREQGSKTKTAIIEIPPPEESADNGVPLVAEVLL